MEEIQGEEFDSKVLASEGKTLVLFYATWCPFCESFKPSFEKADVSPARKVAVTIDEDENPLWDRFDIQAVPTMVAFEKGKVVARRDAKRHVGLTRSDLEAITKELD